MPRDRGSKHRDHFSPSIMNKFFLPLFPISRFLSTFQCCVSSRLCMNMGTKSSEWAEWVDNRSIAYRCLSLHCLHLLLKINKLVKTNKHKHTYRNKEGYNESTRRFQWRWSMHERKSYIAIKRLTKNQHKKKLLQHTHLRYPKMVIHRSVLTKKRLRQRTKYMLNKKNHKEKEKKNTLTKDEAKISVSAMRWWAFRPLNRPSIC